MQKWGKYKIKKEEALTINLMKLAPFIYKKQKMKAKRKGFIVNACTNGLKNDYLKTGFRFVKEHNILSFYSKPYNRKVLNTLSYSPVELEEGKLHWQEKNHFDALIDVAISRRFPNISFEVIKKVKIFTEEKSIRYIIRNGEIARKD